MIIKIPTGMYRARMCAYVYIHVYKLQYIENSFPPAYRFSDAHTFIYLCRYEVCVRPTCMYTYTAAVAVAIVVPILVYCACTYV